MDNFVFIIVFFYFYFFLLILFSINFLLFSLSFSLTNTILAMLITKLTNRYSVHFCPLYQFSLVRSTLVHFGQFKHPAKRCMCLAHDWNAKSQYRWRQLCLASISQVRPSYETPARHSVLPDCTI